MLKIRLSQTGRKNAHTYRIVVKETRSKRDGDYVDLIGHYNPLSTPAILKVDETKLKDWQSKGAQLTEGVAKILAAKSDKPTKKPSASESQPAKTKSSKK